MLSKQNGPESEAQKLTEAVLKRLREKGLLASPGQLSSEHIYDALPLCVIDAVFSIGVRYEGVRNTVARFCTRSGWVIYREWNEPPRYDAPTISQFLAILADRSPEYLAEKIFVNRQRTSSRAGILKAEATRLFGQALLNAGIDTFHDMQRSDAVEEARERILRVPGQKSGISFEYFRMLAGSDEGVKADRMIVAFVSSAFGGRHVDPSAAAAAVRDAAQRLRTTIPGLTPRWLDNIIWKHQRSQKPTGM